MRILSGRQKLGIALILIAGVGAVVIRITTSSLFDITSTKEIPSAEGPIISTTIHTHRVPWRYKAPIIGCAALGFCCLLIPPRHSKPGPPAPLR